MTQDINFTQKIVKACRNKINLQHYVDFSSIRGNNYVTEMQRTITLLGSDASSCQLFTGYIGCGKSIELLKLKSKLEEEGFYVTYFDITEDLELEKVSNIDITDILLSIARRVHESLKLIQIKLELGYFNKLFKEFQNSFNLPDFEVGGELSIGIAKITAKAKETAEMRSKIKESFLQPRTSDIVSSINNDIFKCAAEPLSKKGKKGLVVIVDNLDRVDSSPSSSEKIEYRNLFIDPGERLKKLQCHIIYTIPLALTFSSTTYGQVTQRLSSGVPPKVLTMVDVNTGIDLLRQVVLARAFPEVTEQERINLIPKLFQDFRGLDYLCKVSGGHLGQLLSWIQTCCANEDPPFSVNCVKKVVREYCEDLARRVKEEDWDLLFQVLQKQTLTEQAEYQILLQNMLIFEYRTQKPRRFEINPALKQTERYRSLAAARGF